MNYLIIGVFALTMMGGLYLASLIFRNKAITFSEANIHGAIALLGLVLLLYHTLTSEVQAQWLALGLLLVTALGGVYLYYNHKRGTPGPKSAVIIHAVFATAG